ncbi:MAG: hypothetical protein PHV20_09085 [Bacteroidales bacterium]|nr:hypothetical protein [Bacteroidales bacterium]
MNEKYEIFPNISSVAYYSSFGQYICLSKYNEKESLDKLRSVSKDDFTIELLSTLNHELQHWIDHTSTVWGLENTIKIYNAINSKLNNKESDFWRIASLMKDYKQSSYSEYYHVVHNKTPFSGLENRWSWNISMGLKFDHDGCVHPNNPIIFVRFNDKKGEPISRTPISIHSFLETNSMYKELVLKAKILQTKKNDIVEYHIKQKEFLKDNLRWIYNPELTVYSVNSHAVSNILGISDISLSMEIASQLSTFILNMPPDFYDKIPINKYFNSFKERALLFVSQKDKGFIFLNILYNYKDSFTRIGKFDLENLLKDSGLPTTLEIETLVKINAEKLYSQIINGPLRNKLEIIYHNGIRLLEKRGSFNQNVVDFEYLQSINFYPFILWGDKFLDLDSIDNDLVMHKIRNQIDLNFEEWYIFEEYILKQFGIFSNICGI